MFLKCFIYIKVVLLICLNVLAQQPYDLQTPFEKIAIIKKQNGEIEKREITHAKKVEGSLELYKPDGAMALLPAADVIAVIPQYPQKGKKYKLEDVKNALRVLKALPQEYALSETDLQKWVSLEEILLATTPEPETNGGKPSNAEVSQNAIRDVASSSPTAGVTFKNVIEAEELYHACKGPLGSEIVGKSVIVEGVVDRADSFSLFDGFTKPKNIYLIGAPRPGGGNYHVKCEIRGPVVFLFESGNLYARYVELEETNAKNKTKGATFYTVDGQAIEGSASTIDTNVEFPLINQGNRLMIAQKMKIVGINKMGDLELVGANIQKEPLSWDEIQKISENQRTKTQAYQKAGGKYRFTDLFIEIEQ